MADSKLRTDHSQLYVIFGHMKFIKDKLTSILHFLSTAVLLNREISQSFLKTLMRAQVAQAYYESPEQHYPT